MFTLTYYDPYRSRRRIKRRYVWAFWAFFAGILFGFWLMPQLLI